LKIKEYFKKCRKEENGNVIVIVAMLMTVIMGFSAFAIDLGMNYNESSIMQKGLDSIALAAVRELPADNISSPKWNNAVNAAIKYAELNNIEDITESSLTPLYEDGKITGLTVRGSNEITYNFIKIFGINKGTVNKKATAKLLKVSGVSGLLPLALPKAVMDKIIDEGLMGQNITLKLGPEKVDGIDEDDMRDDFEQEFDLAGNEGWRGAINFVSITNINNTLPGGDYKSAMESGGFNHIVNIGDPVTTNSGTMPVLVEGKIVIGQNATIPVLQKDVNGVLRIVGFVTFKITNLEGNNGNQKKVSIVTSSYVSNYITAGDTEAGIITNDYGVRAAKLVDY
jgi:hypothetical protein